VVDHNTIYNFDCAHRMSYRRINLERKLQEDALSEEEKMQHRQALQQQERDYFRLQRQRLTSDDFEALKLIGRGAFGEVCLCACLGCATEKQKFVLCPLMHPNGLLNVQWCLQVWLCREQKTEKIVALKKLKKSEMLRRGQVDHVKAERNVLAEIHNPFIVRLYYSFQVQFRLIQIWDAQC
jgi:serine/threonine kinase 38